MVSINRLWWEHLAPKVAHRRIGEVEAHLRKWCRSDYGAHWLSAAEREGGILRVKPGQFIPRFHIIALGNNPLFLAPMQTVRDKHRTVGPNEFRSGIALADSELALRPEIIVEVVTDEVFLSAARSNATLLSQGHQMNTVPHIAGVKNPSILFSIPANFLLSPTSWPKRSFVLYQHIFGAGPSYPNDGFFYVGVTTRTWQSRWAEHVRAIQTGSPLLFHRKYRDELLADRVTYIHHKVMGITDNIEALYDAEEALVQGHWFDARRLNMIPGGKSGLRYMRENGMLPQRVIPLPDERDRIVSQWLHDHPRKGLPAPWVSEKWKDDAWAIAQICGREGRLSVEQVRAIRELALTFAAEEIAVRIGALNTEQVERVLEGKTYTRVT